MADDALTAAVKRKLYPDGTDPTTLAANTTTQDPSAATLTGQPSGLSQFGTYDPTFESAMQGITGQQNSVNDQYSQALQGLRNAYGPQYQDLQSQYGKGQTTLQNHLAGNGILYSSNNAQAQGDLGSQFQSLFSQLQGQQQAGEAGLANQRNSLLQGLTSQSLSAQGAHAGFLAQDAENRAAQQAAADAATAQKAQTDRDNVQRGLESGMTPEQISAQLGIPVIGISSNSTGQYVPSTTVTTPMGTVAPGTPPVPTSTGAGGQVNYSGNDQANMLLQNLTQGLDQYGDSPWAVGQGRDAFSAAQNNPDIQQQLQSTLFDAIKRRLGLPVAGGAGGAAPSDGGLGALLARSGLSLGDF